MHRHVDDEFLIKFYEQHGIMLCGCLQVGDESYDSYIAEKDGILSSLARRAKVRKIKVLKQKVRG